MKAISNNRQSLFDIALQYCGSASAVFDIAKLNGLSITAHLEAGTALDLPETYNKTIVNHYNNNDIQPATDTDNSKDGIGYWILNSNFIVQ